MWKWLKRLVLTSKSKTTPFTIESKQNQEGNFKEGRKEKKKQLENRVGGKIELWLAPFQRQPTASYTWTGVSISQQSCSSPGQLWPQPRPVCRGQGGSRGLRPQCPLASFCGVPSHPWASNSAPLESGWIASCHRPGAELPVLPALSWAGAFQPQHKSQLSLHSSPFSSKEIHSMHRMETVKQIIS